MKLKLDKLFDGHNKITDLYQRGKYKEAKKLIREAEIELKNLGDYIKEVKQTAIEKERTFKQ